ncbi:MAG: DNA polymerase/3'-5' exonuclease PolX [Saprospiraceae bacterium]|nr:DNA polymerase/3'-5' exonuclease PolX [Saprospiraceae bacterium]
MTNKDFAVTFKLLGDLMDLHDENEFKVKSYANTYLAIRKYAKNLTESSESEIRSIPGIGKAAADKIIEFKEKGRLEVLDHYLSITPSGIIHMLKVRGLGPKKVKIIWKELGIEDIADLLLACEENRLISAKGFGAKTQQDIKEKITFFMSSSGKYHYAVALPHALSLLSALQEAITHEKIAICGDIRRKMPVVSGIEILTTASIETIKALLPSDENEKEPVEWHGIPVSIYQVENESFTSELFSKSASESFLSKLQWNRDLHYEDEVSIFKSCGLGYIEPEFRESSHTIELEKTGNLPRLIEVQDILGLIHNHSTYSDGLHSLGEMANAAAEKGFKYMVISDHSVSAFYAGGLDEEKLLRQWDEIEAYNTANPDFRIFKGIESDILYDGRLDYRDEILVKFEVIIASIHSNLKMDLAKATSRLITAIENPFTRILGHPTGRLLLGRSGYPIDHQKVIDACAANQVAIELNANPLRMDIDWEWIPYALDKGVLIAINPDAHSIAQIDFVRFGVETARKGGLSASNCLNTMNASMFANWVKDGKNIRYNPQ